MNSLPILDMALALMTGGLSFAFLNRIYKKNIALAVIFGLGLGSLGVFSQYNNIKAFMAWLWQSERQPGDFGIPPGQLKIGYLNPAAVDRVRKIEKDALSYQVHEQCDSIRAHSEQIREILIKIPKESSDYYTVYPIYNGMKARAELCYTMDGIYHKMIGH